MTIRRAVLTPLAVGATAVGLAACGGFDSKGPAESLVKNYVKKYGHGDAVKAVNCPGNVKYQVGGSYTCTLTLFNPGQGRNISGTVTIHMVSGTRVEIFSGQDFHANSQ